LVGIQHAEIYRFINKKGLFLKAKMRQERCTKVYIHVSMEDVCRKKYLSEHLRDGRLEGWYTGVFKCGSDGVME
jgi:hypothetical protein